MKRKLMDFCFIPLLTAIYTVIIGVLFSLLTGYKASAVHLVVRLIVWIVNIAISYIGAFYSLKFLSKDIKLYKTSRIMLSIIFSVLLVVLISGDLECLYVSTLIFIFGLYEIIERVIKNKKSG